MSRKSEREKILDEIIEEYKKEKERKLRDERREKAYQQLEKAYEQEEKENKKYRYINKSETLFAPSMVIAIIMIITMLFIIFLK